METRFEVPAGFDFGRYAIFPRRREILADGRPMELGSRAFDVLVALIEADGAVVAKDELMRRVWPDRVVEDNSLHAQIKALRRAFSGDDLIRTIVGRGYQFRGEIRAHRRSAGEPGLSATAAEVFDPSLAPTNLP